MEQDRGLTIQVSHLLKQRSLLVLLGTDRRKARPDETQDNRHDTNEQPSLHASVHRLGEGQRPPGRPCKTRPRTERCPAT